MFSRSDDLYKKEKKSKKTSEETQLTETFLPEGGGLDASKLDKLNMANRTAAGGSMRKSKSRLDDSTHINGLEAFDVDGTGLFQDLTKRNFIDTEIDVVSMVVAYDSKRTLAICNDQDEEFHLQSYSLQTQKQEFKKVYKGTYIKMNLIEQDYAAKYFAVAYQDNGKFFLSVVSNTGEELDNLNVSKLLALDDQSKPITGFWEPLITCSFIQDDNLFVSCYHRLQKKQYHFLYSFLKQKPLSEPIITEIKDPSCSQRNFPVKSFYSPVTQNCTTFYRQGYCLTVNSLQPSECTIEKITDSDLGTMYLLFDQALVVRSSSSILFFKKDEETDKWMQYEKFDNMRGQIYFIRGNVRIQIVTDEKIYFYMINKETFEPTLENVMYNNMQCSQLMFGARVRYGVSYKTNQPGFTLYSRKYFHNFKVAITQKNYEGAKGANLAKQNKYVIAQNLDLGIYESDQFQQVHSYTLSSSDKDTQILYLTVSDDEQKIGVALGKVLIKDKQIVTEIVVFKKLPEEGAGYEIEKIREFEFDDACQCFVFSKKNTNEMFFFTTETVFLWDYKDEGKERRTFYSLSNTLDDHPKFGVFNNDQTKFIVTSSQDILYVDTSTKAEIDLDDREQISSIQNIISNDSHFYVLANKKEGKLGYYLFDVEMKDPDNDSQYLINWNNKLDIGNCDMHMMVEENQDKQSPRFGTMENAIVISYKSIDINTFNVFVIDLHTKLIKYWHEGYQLWESPVKGFLLPTNDFLILSKDGINVLALGEKEKRVIKDQEGFQRSIHSLGSCNYLKIEPTNHILFACQFYDDRQICIQEQYNDQQSQTQFEDIFKIKVYEITLRELMLIQSIYACKTQSDIELLVKAQPTPAIFFKVFLELGIKSMISYLAFDSRSTKTLLSADNKKYFEDNNFDKFPVFYKNKDQRSAIDVALGNNQIRSVNLMINYICEFQNKYVYAHLFEFNLVDLVRKEVQMTRLFNSAVFNYTFDYDEWPATNPDTSKILAPYNKSIFKIRYEYPEVFNSQFNADEKVEEQEEKGIKSTAKVFKIQYQCNLLTSVSEEDGDLMSAIADSNELSIFETDLIRDMIDYKWQAYSANMHRFGALIHIIYVFTLMYYISDIFLRDETYDKAGKRISPQPNKDVLYAMCVCLIYPLVYDGTQMVKQGSEYLQDIWNYVDIMHIGLGYFNCYSQMFNDTWGLLSKITIIFVILICLLKTFFFMRIIQSFSYIVTMIMSVVADLKVFMIFFTILILMFSMVFDVIAKNDAAEYQHVGWFMGNFLTTLRLSLGDFDFGVLEGDNLDADQHVLFWIIWTVMVIFSSLIFLNFIIAEVSNSYQTINEQINALIYKERACLIQESEDIMATSTKENNKTKFPKYIIIRELEE